MCERIETDTAGQRLSAPVDFEAWPQTSRVETDRFCFRCGYNLYHQTVRREPRTEVLMSRCPECGTYHPAAVPAHTAANRLQRIKGVLMIAWILLIAQAGFMLGVLHAAAVYFTFDEATRYVSISSAGRYYAHTLELSSWYLEQPGQRMLLWVISGGSSFGLGFLGTIAALVLLPHWRKWARIAAIVVWAVVPAAIAWLIFREEALRNGAAHLVAWSLSYVVAYAGCFLVGGLLGMLVGKPLVNLCVRVFVPPRWRVFLEAISPAGDRSQPST